MNKQIEKNSGILAEAEKKITKYREKYPSWPLDPRAEFNTLVASRDEKEVARRKINSELNAAGKKLQELLAGGLSTFENQLAMDDIARLTEKKKQIITEEERVDAALMLYKDLEKNPEFLDYIDEVSKKKSAEKRIQETKKELAKSQTTSQVQGGNPIKSPFGKVTIPINHLENIINDKTWRDTFCQKNNLQFEDKTRSASFKTNTGAEIEINPNVVQLTSYRENDDDAIRLTVELYLKSCENKKITKHHITSSDAVMTEKFDSELSAQLKANGEDEADINNKKMSDIIGTSLKIT